MNKEPVQNNFIENNLLILSKQTMDLFLAQENPGELIALYSFYYYTAKWQKTNQIKASISYTAKGLKWGEDKVRKYKKVLIDLGLIEDFKRVNETSKKVEGWYIKVSYIWKEENHPVQNPEGGNDQRVDSQDPNALSANNKNAFFSFTNVNGGKPQSFNNLSGILQKKLATFKQKPKNSRINYEFQAYAVEAADAAGLKSGGRGRLFQLFKQKHYGHYQLKKVKEVVSHPIFQKLQSEDAKVRYIAGALKKSL